MDKVGFILLILSLFILGAIVLAILLDQSDQNIHCPDVALDIIFFDKGRDRAELQFELWKRHWISKIAPRFYLFRNNGDNTSNLSSDLVIIGTAQSETDLFSTAQDLIPDTANRYFIWASDNVVPLVNVSTVDFHVPHSPLHRFFGGLNINNVILSSTDTHFESILPVGLFAYSAVKATTLDDLRLQFFHQPTLCYSYIYQDIVLVSDSDVEKLKKHKKDELFQVVHISSRASDPSHLNTLLLQYWRTLIT